MRCQHALFIAAVLMPTVACRGADSPPAAAKKAAPATVQHPRTEADLTTVTLTAEAVRRLGIETVAATVESVSGTRTVGGEVVVPEGRSLIVSAPVAGTLVSAGTARAGARVGRGDVIFRLLPLAPGERDQRIDSDRDAASAQAEAEAARQRLERLERLLKEGAASLRSVEEARAQAQVTAAALAAARERGKAVARHVGRQGEISIPAPFAGVLQSVSAAQGQTVAASAPLFEVAQVDTLWVRVPIYAGDARDIDPAQPVVVSTLDTAARPQLARRVTAPLKADAGAASIDLFFELQQASATTLRPGERVSVQVPLTASGKGLVIPDSAIVYDVHGATWVYEDLGNNAFARRRIEVARHVGARAVISRGLAEGRRIVSVGAAELFGTEFGAGK